MYRLIDYTGLSNFFKDTAFETWSATLATITTPVIEQEHGDIERWLNALTLMPVIYNPKLDCKDHVQLWGECREPDALYLSLKALMPWRKGPFTICDTHIDSEWHCDFKWDRLAPHLDLNNKTILDVGCGNGYYGFRMLGAGAKAVIGIDPNKLFLCQFSVIKQTVPTLPIWQLPLTLEQFPLNTQAFDMTFSMGVLYHRKSPIDHLMDLKATLRKGGQLLLETLIVEGDEMTCLVPKDRYAQMRNVWFLPSPQMLTNWLIRVGFTDVKILDISVTTPDEQRTTNWMQYQSLADFLDPEDASKTIEGYPAPKRVVMLATNP